MERWHAGRTVGRTLYKGDGPDDLIGIVDTRELAQQVVDDHNRIAQPEAERDILLEALERLLPWCYEALATWPLPEQQTRFGAAIHDAQRAVAQVKNPT